MKFKSSRQRKAVMAKYHYKVNFPLIKNYSEHYYTTPKQIKKIISNIKRNAVYPKDIKNINYKKISIKKANKEFGIKK